MRQLGQYFVPLWLTALLLSAPGAAGTEGTNAVSGSRELAGKLLPHSGGPLRFKSDSGNVYLITSNKLAAALFTDTNLHAKTLLLKGRPAPRNDSFEITGNLRSLRDGEIHDLYYYCEICAIKQIDPGPCMCCRDPVELREEPVAK